jgi:hypothetical protein
MSAIIQYNHGTKVKGGSTMKADERTALKAELAALFAQLTKDELKEFVEMLSGKKQG